MLTANYQGPTGTDTLLLPTTTLTGFLRRQRMRRLLVCIFTFLLSASCLAQNKHPFTFEDMMALKRVGEPVPSPDGKWVLFSAVDVNLDANTKTPHVWMVPLSTDTHVSQRRGDM